MPQYKHIKLLENVERVLAIELLNASQALFFRRPKNISIFMRFYLVLGQKSQK